jgi:hypothetical protein
MCPPQGRISKVANRRCTAMDNDSLQHYHVLAGGGTLYIMRIHLSEAAWWEQYAHGSGDILLERARPEFDRMIKGKLIIDLVGNLEHSFRIMLRQLDPTNKASDFSALYNSLFRSNIPYLRAVPSDWQSPLEILRRVRNTVHNAWMFSPENSKDISITYRGTTYNFIVNRQLNFISWDLLCDIAEDVLRIVAAVVRDESITSIPVISDPVAGEPLP